MEGSFADAANNHGFKRARWRRLWRQQIQDYLIALIQNVRILLRYARLSPAVSLVQPVFGPFNRGFLVCKAELRGVATILDGFRLELLPD